MKDKIEDYQLYKRCKICGEIIGEEILDDNDGLCDYCFIENNTWREMPFGKKQI